MAQLRVTCINKTDRFNPHERIRSIGGAGWKHSQPDAINNIILGINTYYVQAAGRTVNVVVATHNGNRYLKTEADGVQPDNLLSLPECP
jgi:hypothetical protein